MLSSVLYVVISILIAFVVPNATSKLSNQRLTEVIDQYLEKKASDSIKP